MVYCGNRYASSRVFSIAARLLDIKPDLHCQHVLELMPGPLSNGRHNEKCHLIDLLRKFSSAEAHDERDKIFALLGMSTATEGSDALVADYSKRRKT